jgi:hypothetical protein
LPWLVFICCSFSTTGGAVAHCRRLKCTACRGFRRYGIVTGVCPSLQCRLVGGDSGSCVSDVVVGCLPCSVCVWMSVLVVASRSCRSTACGTGATVTPDAKTSTRVLAVPTMASHRKSPAATIGCGVRFGLLQTQHCLLSSGQCSSSRYTKVSSSCPFSLPFLLFLFPSADTTKYYKD